MILLDGVREPPINSKLGKGLISEGDLNFAKVHTKDQLRIHTAEYRHTMPQRCQVPASLDAAWRDKPTPCVAVCHVRQEHGT